jgi:hypothetical protein
MPDDRPKHGKNGVSVDPKSSVGMQHKNRYGEVLPETKVFHPTLRMEQADPTTKEWKGMHEEPTKAKREIATRI